MIKSPSTRYLGSKRKLLPHFNSIFSKYNFNSIYDAFSGTCSVSYLFKCMNKKVITNDQLLYSYHTSRSIIENCHENINLEHLEFLINIHPEVTYYDIISANYVDFYYTHEENVFLDVYLSNLDYLHTNSHINDIQKSQAIYIIGQAALIKRPFNLFHRRNLNLRTNNINRSFGNKTTWDRPFTYYIYQFYNELISILKNDNIEHKSHNSNIFEISNIPTEAIYIDPPYFSNKRNSESSQYLKNYSFLDGLSDYNNWGNRFDLTSVNKSIRIDKYGQQLNKLNLMQAIDHAINSGTFSTVFISYNSNDLNVYNNIIQSLATKGYKTKSECIDYKYTLTKNNGSEILIIGTK